MHDSFELNNWSPNWSQEFNFDSFYEIFVKVKKRYRATSQLWLLELMMLENQQWATRQTRDRNDICTTQKRKDLTESTGVVSAEYPSKVKLELLTALEC